MAETLLAIGKTISFGAATGTTATALGAAAVGTAGFFGMKAVMGSMGGVKSPKGEGSVPTLTQEQVDAEDEGWINLVKRAAGRRETILTSPQFQQVEPTIKRATLLAG